MNTTPSFEHEITKAGRDSLPVLKRAFIACWNIIPRTAMALGLMRPVKKHILPIFSKHKWIGICLTLAVSEQTRQK